MVWGRQINFSQEKSGQKENCGCVSFSVFEIEPLRGLD
jgi:hypothetical protein